MATKSTGSVFGEGGRRLWFGREIKNMWTQATVVECLSFIFGDLRKGDRFIAMPFPGDNEGNGGLLGGHHLFMKTNFIASGDLSTNAVRLSDGSCSHLTDDLLVIKID